MTSIPTCFVTPVALLLTLSNALPAAAQYEPQQARRNSSVQMGAAVQATVEFQRAAPHLRVGLSAGVGSPAFDRYLYPTVNVEWQVYAGGLGTQSEAGQGHWFSTDLVGALTLTTGGRYQFRQQNERLHRRNRPLYYFSDLAFPALQNPYAYSLSVGTVVLVAGDGRKSRLQRIGYIGAQVRGGHVSYYNDGGGMQQLGLGDGRDRYFTGGGFLGLDLPASRQLNHLQLSYHKFSGYYANAFEVASDLNLGFVNYRDPQQEYYNKSYLNLTAGNVRQGWNAFARLNNPYNRLDIQNTIHYVGNDAYHQVAYPRYVSLGGTYVGGRSTPGLR